MREFLYRLVQRLHDEARPLSRNKHFHAFGDSDSRRALRIDRHLRDLEARLSELRLTAQNSYLGLERGRCLGVDFNLRQHALVPSLCQKRLGTGLPHSGAGFRSSCAQRAVAPTRGAGEPPQAPLIQPSAGTYADRCPEPRLHGTSMA